MWICQKQLSKMFNYYIYLWLFILGFAWLLIEKRQFSNTAIILPTYVLSFLLFKQMTKRNEVVHSSVWKCTVCARLKSLPSRPHKVSLLTEIPVLISVARRFPNYKPIKNCLSSWVHTSALSISGSRFLELRRELRRSSNKFMVRFDDCDIVTIKGQRWTRRTETWETISVLCGWCRFSQCTILQVLNISSSENKIKTCYINNLHCENNHSHS